jgi:PAS domain S-box-containing protein
MNDVRKGDVDSVSELEALRSRLADLEKSEERYRRIVEQATDIICTVDLRTGIVSSANSFGTEALGYRHEDVVNTLSFLELVHLEDQEKTLDRLKGLAAEGTREPNFPLRLRKADDTYLDAEVNGTVTYDSESNPDTFIGVIRDVTEHKRLIEELRESEEMYRGLFENSIDSIFTADLQGTYTSCNPTGEELLGYSVKEIVGVSFKEHLVPECWDMVSQEYDRLYRTGVPIRNIRYDIIKKNGEQRTIEGNVVLIRKEGKPVGFRSTARDITERRQAEEQLRVSEEKYRTLLDTLDVGFYETDLAGNLMLFNDTIRRYLGYSDTELMGMNYRQYVDGENAEMMYRAFNTVYRTGKTDKAFVCTITSKNGTKVPVEFSVSLIRDGEGQPVGFRGITRDITERRRAEEQLRTSEEKYRTIFEESKDVIYISTPDGGLLDINPAGVELFGYASKEEFLKIDIARDLYMAPSGRDLFQKTIEEQGFVKDYELTFKRKDGQPVIVVLTAGAVRNNDGEIIAYRGIMRDITEKKLLEQQLIQAQKMESVGTLAGGIAHDFKNLLGGILGYASFMKSRIEKDHPFFNYIDTIEKSSMRAAELTAQLLAFARGGKYDTRPVNLNSIVDETLKIIARTFDKSIEIKTRLCEPLPTVEADAGQMQQALMNLCVNAGDAMADGGELTIETEVVVLTEHYAKAHMGATTGSHVVLSVTDTGIGMDHETAQRIFEPFFTTKEKGKGTGLGLSMVYGVVKNHGGHVSVHSKPGEGTTFKVHLPISGKPEVKSSARSEIPRNGDELILVVDDEEAIRSLAKDTLECYGYRVLTTENGAEAIEVYREHKDEIGLVILDMVMPKMGGREAFIKLKELDPHVKAILSTGYSQDGKAQEILDSGVMGFIQKPYQLNELLSKVRSLLDTRVQG